MTARWPLLIPVVLLGGVFMLAAAATRRTRWHPAFWLSLLYFGSCLASLLVNTAILDRTGIVLGEDAWVSLSGYAVAIALFLTPAFVLRNGTARRIDVAVLERFTVLSAPLVIFSAAYLLPIAWAAVSAGADVVRSDLNNYGITMMPSGPLTTIAVVVAHFYFVYALVFAISTCTGGRWWVRVVAFIGSTLYILNGLCFAARDGMLWFVVAYIWALWYARPLMSQRRASRIKRYVMPVAIAGLAVFFLLSVQRFGDRREGSLGDYLLLYYGAQPYVFATDVAQQEVFYGGKLRFPLLFESAGVDPTVIRTTPYEWSFGTFVKDIYAEGGWLPVFLSAFMVPPLLIFALYTASGRYPEAYALCAMLYVQFMAQGVFYLRMGNRVGNLYIGCIVALVFLMFALRTNTGRLMAK